MTNLEMRRHEAVRRSAHARFPRPSLIGSFLRRPWRWFSRTEARSPMRVRTSLVVAVSSMHDWERHLAHGREKDSGF